MLGEHPEDDLMSCLFMDLKCIINNNLWNVSPCTIKKKKDSYPFQSAGFNHPLVLVRVHGLPEQDVAADGAGVDPGLLGGVGQLTFHLERALLCRQLSENGAQQRRLEESREEAPVSVPSLARPSATLPWPESH